MVRNARGTTVSEHLDALLAGIVLAGIILGLMV